MKLGENSFSSVRTSDLVWVGSGLEAQFHIVWESLKGEHTRDSSNGRAHVFSADNT